MIRETNRFKAGIQKVQVNLYCKKEKHKWQHGTWGSAFVDNLDETYGIWEISTRTCHFCGKHELKLKNGWERAKKGLTINDLR